MKKLIVSALMLSGVIAFAQEKTTTNTTQTQTTTTQPTTAQPSKTQQPGQTSDRVQPAQGQPATTQAPVTTEKKTEAVTRKEETARNTEKKADPAKRE